MIDIKYGKRKVLNYRGAKVVIGGLTMKNKLDILLYIAREFAQTNSEAELFERVISLCTEIFENDNVTLRLWQNGHLVPVKYVRETEPPRRALNSGEGFSGKVYSSGQPLLVEDLTRYPEFLDPGEETRCVVCVPIHYKEDVLGTLAIEKDVTYFYKHDDLEILEAMSSQLGLALNEVRLVEGLVTARSRIESDLRMGRNVQSQIIPDEITPWNGIHFSHYFEPMVEVSGDYFDVISRANYTTAIIVDVSGHGVPAALVTMAIHHHFQRCVERGLGLPEIMEELNMSVKPKLPEGTYFTAQVVRVYNDHTFSYVSAGHFKLLQFFYESGAIEQLDSTGIPLGIMDVKKSEYEEKFGKLEPGDFLIMMTDGFAEQKDLDSQELGVKRTLTLIQQSREALLEENSNINPVSLLDQFLKQWRAIVGDNAAIDDDLTTLIMQCNPEKERATSLYRKARQNYGSDEEKSLELAREAYEVDCSMHENLIFLAKVCFKRQNYENCARYLREYIAVVEEAPAQIYAMLGSVLFKISAIQEAKRELKKALAIEHTMAEASMMLAKCYLKENSREKAKVTLQRALQSTPGHEKLRTALRKLEKKNYVEI